MEQGGSPLRDKEMFGPQFPNQLSGRKVKMGLDYLPIARKTSYDFEKEQSISGILKWPSQSQKDKNSFVKSKTSTVRLKGDL